MEVGRLGHSNHSMIMTKVAIRNTEKTEEKPGLDYNKADWEAMRRDLGQVNWRTELEDKTAEQSWELLRTKIQETVEKTVPEKET